MTDIKGPTFYGADPSQRYLSLNISAIWHCIIITATHLGKMFGSG